MPGSERSKKTQKNTAAHSRHREEDKLRCRSALLSLAAEIGIFAAVLIIVFTVFFGITVQHGNDMYPALKDGDVVLYYRTDELINTEPCVYKAAGSIHTGRVAATGGTVIGATGDLQLTFDGIYMPASAREGIYSRTYAAEGEPLPVTVKDGYYFVLGDNRESAEDSRVYGQISSRNVRGRIITVLRRRQI